MTAPNLDKYRKLLDELVSETRESVADAEEQARQPTGAQGDGGLSNVPMHLGDLGTEAYLQELNSTLAESQQDLSREVHEARRRLNDGTFGICEECGQPIPEARLDVIPYTRYCVGCAERVDTSTKPNLNTGRPHSPLDTLANRVSQGVEPHDEGTIERSSAPDAAMGAAGGGTAIGGLAGTNLGAGDPADVDLDRATASSRFEPEAEEVNSGYAGRAGGAVGGSPANGRVTPRRKQTP